jgi:hypothetical protein
VHGGYSQLDGACGDGVQMAMHAASRETTEQTRVFRSL